MAPRKKSNQKGRKNSSQKGSTYERKIAKILNKEIFGFDAVYRQTTSGGLKRETLYTGDIVPLNNSGIPRFPFHIECKKGYNWDVLDFMTPKMKSFPLAKFWIQAETDRTNSSVQPYLLLVVGKDFKGDFVIFDSTIIKFKNKAHFLTPQINATLILPNNRYKFITMMRLSSFLITMRDILQNTFDLRRLRSDKEKTN